MYGDIDPVQGIYPQYVCIYIYITGDNSSVGIECAYIEDNLLGMLALITMFGIRGDTINNNKDMIDMMGI